MSLPSSQVQLVSSALKPCVFSSNNAFLLLASTATRSFFDLSLSSHSSLVIGPFDFKGAALISFFDVFPFASDSDLLFFFNFFFIFFSFRRLFFSFLFSALIFLSSAFDVSRLDSEVFLWLLLSSLEEFDEEELDDDVDEEDLLCFLDICRINSLELLNAGFSFFSLLYFFDFDESDLLLDLLLFSEETDLPLLLLYRDLDPPFLLFLEDLDLLLDLFLGELDLLLDLFLGVRDLLLLLGIVTKEQPL